MIQRTTCPGCGTANNSDANWCQGCGKALLHCPECGNLNTNAVAFCTTCGKMLVSGKKPAPVAADSDAEPYVVWEGFPFAWLERRSQTREQYFLWLACYVALFLICAVASLAAVSGSGGGVCCVAFALSIVVVLVFVTWMVGRRGAEEEEKERV